MNMLSERTRQMNDWQQDIWDTLNGRVSDNVLAAWEKTPIASMVSFQNLEPEPYEPRPLDRDNELVDVAKWKRVVDMRNSLVKMTIGNVVTLIEGEVAAQVKSIIAEVHKKSRLSL